MAGTDAQEEIRAVFDQMIAAMNAGDAERVRSLLSERPDAVHIGSDDEEWWTSKQLVDAIAAGGAEGGDGIQGVGNDVEIHVQGDVAWTEGHGRFIGPDGRERAFRMTAVAVREGGQWKVAQSHASLGVPNADMFG